MSPRPQTSAPDPNRLLGIVEAAAHSFALAGYHRTQMADISTRAGVALGTLYRYAASKEDLFAFALAYGVGRDLTEVSALTPIRDVEAFFANQMPAWLDASKLSNAMFAGNTLTPLPDVLAALYDTIQARRLTIRIVDRSAHDLPKLGEIYSRHVREPVMHALIRYLDTLQANNAIAPLTDTAASARLALEVCAWFAMHRLFSPGGPEISDGVARTTALSHLVAAFGSKS